MAYFDSPAYTICAHFRTGINSNAAHLFTRIGEMKQDTHFTLVPKFFSFIVSSPSIGRMVRNLSSYKKFFYKIANFWQKLSTRILFTTRIFLIEFAVQQNTPEPDLIIKLCILLTPQFLSSFLVSYGFSSLRERQRRVLEDNISSTKQYFFKNSKTYCSTYR